MYRTCIVNQVIVVKKLSSAHFLFCVSMVTLIHFFEINIDNASSYLLYKRSLSVVSTITVCFLSAVSVDGRWGAWGNWSLCSATCGTSVQQRERRCDNPLPANGGAECTGRDTATSLCNVPECPSESIRADDIKCNLLLKMKYSTS